ncbi:MAG: cell wall hydrolase [Candidatus Heteroscillospira sp.]|jgi:N-acetylmuramoyl-L-alanine amidase
MSRNLKKLIALICVVLLTVSAGGFALADEEDANASPSDIVLVPEKTVRQAGSTETVKPHRASVVALAASLTAVEFASDEAEVISVPMSMPGESEGEVTVLKYTEIPVYVNDKLAGSAMKIGESTYVPVGDFCEAIGYEVETEWDQENSAAVFTGEGIEISMTEGAEYITANGRCLHTEEIYNINGTMIVPVRELAKCFGAEVEWDEQSWAVRVSAEEIKPLESAETFYDEEDLYWLSRIIFAESGNQSVDGMTGVGNVVLNRVADPTCPDTVYDVIFDNQYGVQFSVTETGAIYMEPSEGAVNAAKMCLEGYNPVGDSLFFVNPAIGASSWFANTRTFVATIGEHDFYA